MSKPQYRRTADSLTQLRVLIGAAAYPDAPYSIHARNLGAELRKVTTDKQIMDLYDYYVLGISMQDIAAERGVSVSTVSRSIERGERKACMILRLARMGGVNIHD